MMGSSIHWVCESRNVYCIVLAYAPVCVGDGSVRVSMPSASELGVDISVSSVRNGSLNSSML